MHRTSTVAFIYLLPIGSIHCTLIELWPGFKEIVHGFSIEFTYGGVNCSHQGPGHPTELSRALLEVEGGTTVSKRDLISFSVHCSEQLMGQNLYFILCFK